MCFCNWEANLVETDFLSLEQAATDISSQIESEAESIQRALEQEVDESAENASIEIENDEIGMRRIIDGFKKFGLWKKYLLNNMPIFTDLTI